MSDSIRTALAEQQGEGPSDKELNILWNCSGIADEHGNHAGNIFEFARAVLSRWGHQPTPPAEGEVAEFITQLKSYAEYGTPIRLIPFVTDRAAELLQQQQPTPVPVNERLPGPGDRNTEGKCWWFCTAYPGDWPHWIFGNEAFCDPTHWLPAHALPLPQGEVEG